MLGSIGQVPTFLSERRATRLLRVLQVTPRYFPYTGGVESHVYQVSRRLARMGVEVTVLTTDPSGQLPAREQAEAVQIRRVRAWPAQRDYYFAPAIYPIIRQGDWDIVHVQSYHTLVPPLAMLAARQAHLPYVLTFHGGGHSSSFRNAARGAQRALLRPLLARAACLVAIAEFEVKLLAKELKLPEARFRLIPNGADLPAVSPRLAEGAPRSTIIASVGRLERYKGHQRILTALPHILKQVPEARLWIAGTGPYEMDLRRLAARLGVADRVDIRAIPPTDRGAMAEELSKVGLVVLLSEYETQPIAILEALALGRPALVADTSGLAELAQRGLARAIPLSSSAEQVAVAAVEQLCRPPALKPLALPTWDDCANGLLALYEAVLQAHGGVI
jgi:glycosyltransferase involved in cell wall biosynthesis